MKINKPLFIVVGVAGVLAFSALRSGIQPKNSKAPASNPNVLIAQSRDNATINQAAYQFRSTVATNNANLLIARDATTRATQVASLQAATTIAQTGAQLQAQAINGAFGIMAAQSQEQTARLSAQYQYSAAMQQQKYAYKLAKKTGNANGFSAVASGIADVAKSLPAVASAVKTVWSL